MTESESKQEHFRTLYEGQPPWDIGRPQPALVAVAQRLQGSLLDVGCGTGDNALFFAQRGLDVTGIDFLQEPIERARAKADEQGIQATFLVMDATQLGDLARQFDCAIDCGLFHALSDEDRTRYVQQLAKVMKPGGRIWLMCFSDKEPPGHGPRRVTRQELREAFAQGWEIESIEDTHFASRPEAEHLFADQGPRAYLAVIKYLGTAA